MGADSTIRVAILGDVKGLSKALGTAEKDVAGFGVNAKKLIGGIGFGIAARELADFAGTALAEADRVGDATTRLELQLGDLSAQLVDTADDFAFLGQSKQDILELEAAFTDAATALQLADPLIAAFADDAAATAAAVALLGDQDAATVIDLIGKAAGGSEKAMKALGISVTDAEVEARALATTGKATADSLTAGELAAARYALVLEALKPKLDAVAESSGDVEQRQSELQARWETLTGKIGEGLEGPMNDLLAWILTGIDGWEQFADRVGAAESAIDAIHGPVRDLALAVASLIGELNKLFGMSGNVPGMGAFGGLAPWTAPASGGGGAGKGGGGDSGVVLNVVPRDSSDTERAVIQALRDYNARTGRLE